jgi:uncharacterized protein
MNLLEKKTRGNESEAAHKRLSFVRGEPFLLADWERVLFLNFTIAPEVLRPLIRAPLKLDLHEGQAYVSLVAVTMTKFRPATPLSVAWPLRAITRQSFLNLRTYVRHNDEPGALFLWGWLSNPLPLHLPTFDLPCAFAKIDYRHNTGTGNLCGEVNADGHRFRYRATFAPQSACQPCSPGSSAEFTMERYTGFFHRKANAKIFRTWHPAWLQINVEVTIEDDSLITQKFDWFKDAKFVGANFAPGFERVSLGRIHSLKKLPGQSRKRSHGPSGIFEMP